MNDRKKVGAAGEKLAAEFLVKNGLRIIARNARTKSGEIDLIAEDGKEVIFVEVKLRRNLSHGAPESAVNAKKLARLFRLAEEWCRDHHWHGKWHLDIIAIDVTGAVPVIKWIKGIIS